MHDHRSSSASRRRRLYLSWTTLASGAVAFGCGAAPSGDPGEPPAPGGESAGQITQALDYCPNPVMCTSVTPLQAITDTSGSAKQLITVAKDFGNAVQGLAKEDYFKFGSSFLQTIFDIQASSPDVMAGISCLNQEVSCVAQGLDWSIKASDWSTQYGWVTTALQDIPVGYGINSNDDNNSHEATLESGEIQTFSRIYLATSTDGDGKWKNIISNWAPTPVGTNQIFDWEAGFTRFMTLVPRRLAIIAFLDPNFALSGTRNFEIEGFGSDPFSDSVPGYRHVLLQRLQQMTDGVRCDYKDRTHWTGGCDPQGFCNIDVVYDHTDLACADVNTGIASESTYTIANYASCRVGVPANRGGIIYHFDPTCVANLPDRASVPPLLDGLRRGVLGQLPVFEVQSMADSLRRFTHPWVPDLTESLGRIPVSANQSLCLDVQWGNPASGTPVWIWDCNGGGAQQWSYDRQAQTITNTAFGKCLQVRPIVFNFPWFTFTFDNRSPGVPIEISDCIDPPPPRQKWTYDPEHNTIRSALGTVLDIQWNNQQAGTPVWTWDFNGGSAQQWFSDRSDSYCNNLCDSSCQAACAGAADPDSCVAGCMQGGCTVDCVSSAVP